MNGLTLIPQHEPFLRSLPRDITLREIARRGKRKGLKDSERIATRMKAQIELAGLEREKQGIARRSLTLNFVVAVPRPETDRQIWGCLTCLNTRSWGFRFPDNQDARPKLNCCHCHAPTRHAFVGVAGKTL